MDDFAEGRIHERSGGRNPDSIVRVSNEFLEVRQTKGMLLCPLLQEEQQAN
jgi:hypothetical protein